MTQHDELLLLLATELNRLRLALPADDPRQSHVAAAGAALRELVKGDRNEA